MRRVVFLLAFIASGCLSSPDRVTPTVETLRHDEEIPSMIEVSEDPIEWDCEYIVIAPPPPEIIGEIESADEAMFTLAIPESIRDLVRVGYEFSVYRDDRFLGKLGVTSVAPSIVATVLYLDCGDVAFSPGDKITNRMHF